MTPPERLSSVKDQYSGNRIFVIGNGPSLSKTPLGKLDNEYTFAMNKINHIYDNTDWRPTFYFNMITDQSESERLILENHECGSTCFVSNEYKNSLGELPNCFYLESNSIDKEPELNNIPVGELDKFSADKFEKYWSYNIKDVVYFYHSMYAVFQIISYLGFDKIHLVGCDLGYGKNDPHMIFKSCLDPLDYIASGSQVDSSSTKKEYIVDSIRSGTPIRSIVNALSFLLLEYENTRSLISKYYKNTSGGDNNHFGSYSLRPKDASNVNKEMIKSHIMAKKMTNKNNIKIVNSTIGGDLEVYPREDIFSPVGGNDS